MEGWRVSVGWFEKGRPRHRGYRKSRDFTFDSEDEARRFAAKCKASEGQLDFKVAVVPPKELPAYFERQLLHIRALKDQLERVRPEPEAEIA